MAQAVKESACNEGVLGVITGLGRSTESKSLQAINAGEDVEKREPSYTVGGNAN